MQRLINITTLKSPNPDSLKLEVDGILLTEGAFDFTSREEALEHSPLAWKFLGLGYIRRVFISKNFVTLTRDPQSGPPWENVSPDLRIVLKKHLEAGEPVLLGESRTWREPEPDVSTEEGKIQVLLEDKIRPATRHDGGDITFAGFENGVVKVKLAGACVGCPFAPRTIKSGIEPLLKDLIPGLTEVTSDDVNWEETQQ